MVLARPDHPLYFPPPPARRVRIAPVVRIVLVAVAMLAAAAGRAATPAGPRLPIHRAGELVTGPAFLQQLGQTWGITGQPGPPPAVLQSWPAFLAIVCDRRIDPDQPVNLSPGEVPLEQAFATLAAERGIG